MATRAERFKSDQQRERQKKGAKRPSTKAKRSTTEKVVRLLQEVSGTVRRTLGTGLRNLTKGKKAAHALEDSNGSKQPSRKSTRRSAQTHQKSGTALTSRQKLKSSTPAARHQQRS